MPIDFSDFLNELNVQKCHIITFLHNRFNVIFHDGGAVYHHHHHIYDFLTSGRSSKTNRLLEAISKSIQDEHLLAECRALGIIGKLIAAPLWHLLERKNVKYFEMNPHWETLCSRVEAFSEDASPLMNGDPIFDVPVKHDEVYESLFSPTCTSPESNDLTIVALQCLCSEMLPMLRRQLADQLPGGKYHCPTEEICLQTSSAPLTNRISEADFSDLDRLEKSAPQKRLASKSGLICFVKNKTSSFLQKLSFQKKNKYLNIARRSAVNRVAADRARSMAIRKKRQQMQRERMELKIEKKAKQKAVLEKLQESMGKVGIWVTEEEVQRKLNSFVSHKKRLAAIKEQIKFHVHILKTPMENPSLGKFQKGTHFYTLDELRSNLISILSSFSTVVPENIILINSSVPGPSQQSGPSASGQPKKKKRKREKSPEVSIPHAPNLIKFEVGDYYAVAFDDAWYPGLCIEITDDENALIKYMKRCGNAFQWPSRSDIMVTNVSGVLSKVTLVPVSGGRQWKIEDLDRVNELYG